MSKNTNLSFLTDYITADITNGRIGINNASPTFAFDVSGTARVSTSLNINTASSGYTTPSLLVNAGAGAAIPLQAIADSTGGRLFRFYTSDFNNTTTGTSIRLNFGAATGNTSANLQVYTGGEQVVAGTILALQPSGGNVGINTTTPTAKLEIYDNSNSGILRLSKDAGMQRGALEFGRNNGGSFQTCGSIIVDSDSASVNNGIMYFYTSNSSGTNTERMRISSNGDLNLTSGVAILNRSGKKIELNPNSALTNTTAEIEITSGMDLFFKLGGSERMRITSGGNVLINKSSASGYPLEAEVFSDGNLAYFTRQGANTKMFMGGTTAGATAFYIQSNTTNGVYLTAGGTSWTANSDIRLKNVISPIDSAVDKLTTLNPVIFSWKSDEENKENIGLIAQDVKEVFPQVIDTNEEGFLGVRYVELVPVLVKAIQELSAKVTLLENK